MTFRKKLMISALASTLLGAAVIPTLAENTATTATTATPAAAAPAKMQLAEWGGWYHDGPRGFGMGGPGMGGPGMGGPGMGGPGMGPDGFAIFLEQFDTNKDGSVSKDEIAAFVSGKMKTYDKDGDGMLSLTEYQALWNDMMQEAIVRSFQRYDRNGDGKVTAAEYGLRFDRILAELDHNKDGTIDQNEMRGPDRGPPGPWHGDHDRWGPRGPGDDGPRGPGGPDGQGGPDGAQ